MRHRFPSLLLLGLVATAGAGCISSATLQTASTLGHGRTEIALEPTLWGITVADIDDDGMTDGGSVALPTLSLSVRHGVNDRFDLGGRVGNGGFELTSKFLLSDPGNPALAVSLAPSIGGLVILGGDAGVGWINVSVPLLFGVKTMNGSELVFGPKIHNATLFGGDLGTAGGALNIVSVGGSLGYAWRTSPYFTMMPEISVLVPTLGVVDATSVDASSEFLEGGALWQVGFSMMFGL